MITCVTLETWFGWLYGTPPIFRERKGNIFLLYIYVVNIYIRDAPLCAFNELSYNYLTKKKYIYIYIVKIYFPFSHDINIYICMGSGPPARPRFLLEKKAHKDPRVTRVQPFDQLSLGQPSIKN
jgi:hypothetical protein